MRIFFDFFFNDNNNNNLILTVSFFLGAGRGGVRNVWIF